MTNLGLGETEKPKTVRQLMSPSGRVRWDRKGPQLGDAARTFFLYFAYSAFTTVAAVAGSSPSASMSRSYPVPFGSGLAAAWASVFLNKLIMTAVGSHHGVARPRGDSGGVFVPPISVRGTDVGCGVRNVFVGR